jgi:hypothetical protein
MAHELKHLIPLQAAIQHLHNCEAFHSHSIPIHEKADGKTIWEGNVEVFDLRNHAEAKKCYAWSFVEKGKGTRFMAVLEKHPITSPEMAVKSAIFFDQQPVPYPRPDSSSLNGGDVIA